MTYVKEFRLIKEGQASVQYGPMFLVVTIYDASGPSTPLALEGVKKGTQIFDQVAQYKGVVFQNIRKAQENPSYPEVVNHMIHSVQRLEDPTFTPMAAVAGCIADKVADFLVEQGGEKVLVDNGGDVAIRLRNSHSTVVGVRAALTPDRISYKVPLSEHDKVGGVATSGLGGHSFTKGIATAATAFAENAGYADAAATLIGNATDVDDPAIERRPAEQINPLTDIPGHLVAYKVGFLSREKKLQALQNGLDTAKILISKGVIRDALVAIHEDIVMTENLLKKL
ncbi:MAG: UPF0280 family protein [Nitrospira sp.]|nr:UPF0280 family protein [Nitrospira sp.]